MLDRLRDMWERMGPRERRLVAMLGVAAVVCALGYAVLSINDSLSALQQRNEDTRAVLASLEQHRDDLVAEKSKQGEIVAMIGEEAPPLSTYLENIGKDTGVQIRNQTDKPTLIKGKFHELATEITLMDITIDQLAKFLRGVETGSPIVVTRHITIRRSGLQKDKFDRVTITVATFERGKKTEAKAGEAAAKPAEEAKP
jgi:Tfp pilus assembly protein PilO